MSNVICLHDCLHYDDYATSYNGQRISLDKLANREMGLGVVCLVYVNGELVPDDWGRVIEPCDQVIFTALAAGGGDDGGKDGFRMLAQIALLAAVVVVAGPAGAALAAATGLAVPLATQIAISSILFVGNLAINTLLPQSAVNDEAEQFKNLSPQNNVARLGQPVSEVFGEMLVYPDLLSQPYTRFIDNKAQLNETFHFTNGVAEVSELKLGKTKIGDFSELSVDVQQDGGIATRYDVTDAQGIELLMPRDDGLPEQVLWGVDEGFTQWFDLCPPYETLNVSGVLDTRFELSLAFLQGVGDEFEVTQSAEADFEDYDFLSGVQLYWQQVDDLGLPNGLSGDFEIKVPVPANGLGDNEAYNCSVIFVDTYVYEQSETELTLEAGAQKVDHAFFEARVQVRLKRMVEKSSDSQKATSVRIASMAGAGQYVANVAGVMVKLTAGQMKRLPVNGGMILNGIVKRHIHTFKKAGNAFVYDAVRFENTPAQVMYHFLHEYFGGFEEVLRLVDLDALWHLHGMNLELGETFNARITTQKKYWDWLVQIGFGMRVKPIRRGAKISFVRDMQTELPNFAVPPLGVDEARYKFNGFHIVKDSMNVTYNMLCSDDVYDGVKLDFIDERIWQHNDYQLALDGGGEPENPIVIEAKGVTSITTVKAIARHMVNAMKYRKTDVSFKTELDGLLPNVGSVIYLAHGLIDKGETAQIYAMSGNVIVLETPLNAQYGFAVLRLGDARASQKIAVAIAGDGMTINLAEMPVVDGAQADVVTFFDEPEAVDTITFYNQLDDEPCNVRVTNMKFTKNGATISGFVDDARVYA
ncbi:MAG: hypothetical protein COB24_08805 [Hyphomicrobiales bacterium]|nr:MAG: hypothetical protein COB24_08805 [Hyphomicrobiales bacterium]